MINSKQKGKAGELEFAHWLTDHGYPARRGQQFCGTPESPDIICDSLPFHFEIKRVQKLNISKAMAQSINDSGDKIPIVAHRRNNEDWLITLRAEDFINLIKNK
jgi:hypothetical protein